LKFLIFENNHEFFYLNFHCLLFFFTREKSHWNNNVYYIQSEIIVMKFGTKSSLEICLGKMYNEAPDEWRIA
jgi:hypothetical protein